MSETPEEEPKIIVDSDWKAQVQAEKEKLKQQEQATSGDAEQADEASVDAKQAADQEQIPTGEIPPASFPMLITTLATQAAAALGQIPDPVAGKPIVNKPLAKHLIDTLAILEEKTRGNLSDDEAQLLGAALHELRFAFVNTKG